MLSKTKKILILSGMLVLLVVTGYLNVLLNSQAADVGGNNNANNMTFFEMSRASRESDYNLDILVNQGIVNTSTDETIKASAEAAIMQMQQTYSKAKDLERLMIGRGFSDCYIHMPWDNPSISVFAKKEELNSESVAIILDLLVTQIGAKAVDVTVNPV